MARLIDFILILDERMTVRRVEWKNGYLGAAIQMSAQQWVGLSLAEIPEAKWDFSRNILVWHEMRFSFERFSLSEHELCLLVRHENLREKLLEGALDTISDSVQVYDAELRTVYFNRAFRGVLDVPSGVSMEGEKLLDIFAVDEAYSTTITALRERQAVKGRFDNYKSMIGKELQTVNEAYPVMEDGRILGIVSIERDMHTTKKMIAELQESQDILVQHMFPPVCAKGNTRYTLRDVIGFSPALISALELAKKVAPNESAVLLLGETGTGKEIFAQGIHSLSARRDKNFVAVNCAAFPESLIEGELFGTVKGAFTGSTDKTGLIEEANHGTLFLDEMNSMSLAMQAKLLRVLQEKKLRRVGGTKEISIDVRIISSCNEDPYRLMDDGRLRRDMFYRLASIVVEIPPLRERGRDLEELTWHYIRSARCAEPILQIEQSFWDVLYRHRWPGNVRELFHILDHALNICEDNVLRVKDLPSYFRNQQCPEQAQEEPRSSVGQIALPRSSYAAGLSFLCSDFERRTIIGAYLACGRNLTKTAELLKISRQNLQYYMRKYGVK